MNKRSLIVQKFGGSSLAEPEQIKAAATRIANLKQSGHRVLVVVSAMGRTTDQLVELAYKISPEPNRRELDMLLTAGERISMSLISMALNDCGATAISLTGSQAGVMTNESHSNARIVDIKPVRVEAELARNQIVVIAGFQGVSPQTKEVTTLGRGGSDTTAVAMAAYFRAEYCEILKDVEGVHSADPRIVADTERLPHLHYNMLLNMTFWGAKVLHYRSVELAAILGIPMAITLAHGQGQSTLVDGDAKMYEQARIISVNSHVEVRRLLITKEKITAAFEELSTILKENSIPLPQLLDTEKVDDDRWAFLITAPSETLNAIHHLTSRYPSLSFEENHLASVSATCQGSFASHLPEELANALESRGIAIQKMILGAMNITTVVTGKDREKAIQILHDLRPIGSANKLVND